MRKLAARALALLLAPGALAGCAGFGADQPIACPPVRILQDGAEVRQFRAGGGRDLTDVTVEARFEGVGGECVFDKGRLDMTFVVQATAALGPAQAGRAFSVPYFVAAIDPYGTVLARERFDLAATFPENFMRVAIKDEISVRLPIGNVAEAPDYTVYVGFELSRDEFDLLRGARRP